MPTKDEMRSFSTMIEKLSKEKRMGYMDAILHHCKETEFEIEVAASLITPSLKAKISEEAQNANMIKRVAKLPI
jgi:predicted CopG family antitoxin